MNYLVRDSQSIWDVAVNSVGVENAINVAEIPDSWDSDLSAFWGSEITLPDVRVVTTSTSRGIVVNLPAINATWKTIDNQSIYDLSAQLLGGLDNVLNLAIENNLTLDSDIDTNLFINYRANQQINRTVTDEIARTATKFSTSIVSGSFLIDEFNDFIVTEFGEKIIV
jgi:hypothetical protein